MCSQRVRTAWCLFLLNALLVCAAAAGPRKLPPSPRKLQARTISQHAIKVKWHDPGRHKDQGSRFYSVRYSAVGQEDKPKFLQTQEKRVRVSKLEPNTTYVFAVKSVVGKQGSPWSATATATTGVTVDSIVRKLQATPLSSRSVRLSWKPPLLTNETVAYAILWAEVDMDKSERTAVVTKGRTSFIFDHLLPHRLYSFRVQSMLSEGPGGSTEKIVVRPYSDKPGKPPRDVILKYSNNSHVLVSWRPPPVRRRHGVLLGYKVQYKRKGSRRGDVCTVITRPRDDQHLVRDVAGGETYKVRVAATNVNGTGPFSAWEKIAIPVANKSSLAESKYKRKNNTTVLDDTPRRPQQLVTHEVHSTSVTLTWTQPPPPSCCPVVAYRILTRNVNTSELTGEMVTGPTPEAKISFLEPDTVYSFNVSAYSIGGESEPSEELAVQTLPAEPPAILQVFVPPVVEGSMANLTCVVRSEPPPEVQWFAPNKTVPFSSQASTNLILHNETGVRVISVHKSSRDVTSHLLIQRVAFRQAGVYFCVAKNSAGTVRSPVRLQVNVSPAIVDVAGMEVMDGRPARLMCSVTGSPLPTVVWVHQDSKVVFEPSEKNVPENSNRPIVTSLVEDRMNLVSFMDFFSTSLDTAGNYTCLARSEIGSTEKHVLLQVKVPLPPSIQNVRALALSPASVSVMWDDPLDYNYTITNYQVEFREERSVSAQVRDTRNKKIELSNLRSNQTYSISVRAGNSYGFGDFSSEVKVQTLTNEGLQPANVSAIALNSSIIQLDWESPRNIDRIYILGYNIYYKRESDTQDEMLFIEGNRNKQFLIGLGRDETYYLRIATLTTWGYEAPSEWIRIQKHPQELLPPVPPRDVKTVTMLESVRVTWQSSNEPGSRKSPLLGYHIVYGPADDPSEINRVDLGPNAVQFAIRGLKPSTKYIVSIRAFNKYAMSEPVYVRAETKALPPSTVVNATAVGLSPTEIHVHWEAPARGNVTRYQLRYWRPGRRDKQSAWLRAPTTDYVAGSLAKFSSYRFEIIPFSEDVIGEGSVIFADTLSSKPDAPPSGVHARPLNSTHLLVTWEEPPEHAKNGAVTGYKIIMKMKKGPRLAKFGVDGNRRNYTFKNLEPGETYKIRMAATTVNGTGPFTDWVTASTEEIKMRQPQNPENLQVNGSAYSITLSWAPPKNIGVPVLGYIVGHGRYIPEVYRSILGPSVRNFTIADLKPDTEYIVSIRAFNHIGESVPEYTLVQTSKAPEMLEVEVPAKLKVIALSPTTIEVSWVDPGRQGDAPAADGRHYFIRYSAISGENYHYLNISSTSVNITDLQAATMYEFAVRTMRGEEQSRWSLPVVNTTQQTAPASPPGNVMVMSLLGFSNTLILNWTEPESPNGKILEYIVYYTSDPTLDTKRWFLKTTEKMMAYVRDILPHTSYYFKVQARNDAGYGPLSKVVIYSPPTDSRAAPGNITVSSLYGNVSAAVEVLWMEPFLSSAHTTGFMVYYTDNLNQSTPEWMIQSERGLSALILGLAHNTTYSFKVRARYGASLGPFSDTINFTTPLDKGSVYTESKGADTSGDNKSGQLSPLQPQGLVVVRGHDFINITWESPISQSPPVTGYEVGIEKTNHDMVVVVNTTELFHTFDNLDADTTYTVRVKAFNKIGYSPPAMETFLTHNLPVTTAAMEALIPEQSSSSYNLTAG